jgi:hypothetical protein
VIDADLLHLEDRSQTVNQTASLSFAFLQATRNNIFDQRPTKDSVNIPLAVFQASLQGGSSMKYVVCVSVIDDEQDEDFREIPDIHLDNAPVVAPVGAEVSIQTDDTDFFGIVKSVRITHQMQTNPEICRVEYVCTEAEV